MRVNVYIPSTKSQWLIFFLIHFKGPWLRFKNDRLDRWKWKLIHKIKGTKPEPRIVLPKPLPFVLQHQFVYPNELSFIPGKEEVKYGQLS